MTRPSVDSSLIPLLERNSRLPAWVAAGWISRKLYKRLLRDRYWAPTEPVG
jgi:hypothetical protein